jgi:hypothetical protein
MTVSIRGDNFDVIDSYAKKNSNNNSYEKVVFIKD